jgi:hypothetical protein
VIFCSLRLENLSLEALLWTLRSLKNDEMVPTERAIQSRMKEAFDLKPNATQWSSLMENIGRTRETMHRNTKSEGVSNESVIKTNSTIPNFSVSYIHDSVIG